MNRSWPTFPQLIVAAVALIATATLLTGTYFAFATRGSGRRLVAKFHETRAAELGEIVEDWRNCQRVFGITKEEGRAVARWIDRLIPYHREMARKWNRGILFPYSPVEPDPIPPSPPDFD